MIARLFIGAALLALPIPALAQDKGDVPVKRIRSILLYGDEKCPANTNPEEIVVCANAGDSPYRIPKRFRDLPKKDAASQSWAKRVETLQAVSRIGLPDSCSAVGTGGQTGCTRQMLQQWYQEKLDKEAAAAQVP